MGFTQMPDSGSYGCSSFLKARETEPWASGLETM